MRASLRGHGEIRGSRGGLPLFLNDPSCMQTGAGRFPGFFWVKLLRGCQNLLSRSQCRMLKGDLREVLKSSSNDGMDVSFWFCCFRLLYWWKVRCDRLLELRTSGQQTLGRKTAFLAGWKNCEIS